ncbi:MAG: carboxymuconolactone decarboxylase family protein [Actinomycetes bacterium]
MPRLRQVRRADASDTARNWYDLIFGPDVDPVDTPGTATGTPGNWWTVMALVPDVFDHATAGLLLYRSPARSVDPVLRELGQLRLGWTTQSRFVFSQHCKAARTDGVDEAKIAAIGHWSAADCYSPAERAVLAFTDGLVLEHGRMSDEVVDTLRTHLSDEAVLELAYILTMYLQHAVMSRALRLEFDDVDDAVAEVPAPDGDPFLRIGPPARG